MSFWEENNAIPVEQAEGDSMMAEMRESLLANLGQTIDAICKGNMQQMAKASRMAAENTILWVVKIRPQKRGTQPGCGLRLCVG